MRTHGTIESGGGLGINDHACWSFDRPQEFADASLEFFADGLRAGQRVAYVGSEAVAKQRERLRPLGDVEQMVDGGALQLFELGDLYPVGKPVNVEAQIAAYTAAIDAALADGFTGLRVAADVTELVVDPDNWEAHVHWESVADRVMSAMPLAALCGYRSDAVPDSLLNDLATVHPATNIALDQAPFRLFGDSGRLVLSGEIDLFSNENFDRILDLALEGEEPLTLDLGELGFIDHHGLETLATHTHRRAAEGGCCVRNEPAIVERLCDLLDLKL